MNSKSNFFNNKEKNKKDQNDQSLSLLARCQEDQGRKFGKNLINTRFTDKHKKLLDKRSAFNKPLAVETKLVTPFQHFLATTVIQKKEEVLEECDLKVKTNPQYIVDYIQDVMHWLKETETVNQPNELFTKKQDELTGKMRAILIDWMIEVHLKFKLLPETLYLSVNIMDRYLLKEVVKKDKFQLLGVTSMLIASKFEEIYPPEIRDFVYITDKAYLKEEISKMEYKVLSALEFDILTVSPYNLLLRFNFISFGDQRCFFIAQYILELILLDDKLSLLTPSVKAASCLYIARKLMRIQPAWPKQLETASGFNEQGLKTYAQDLCRMIDLSYTASLKACRNKFSSHKFLEVSKIFANMMEKK